MRKFLNFMKNIMTFILIQILVCCFISVPLVFYGPFKTLRNIYISTAMTTLSHQYLATAFFSQNVITSVMKENSVDDSNKKSDVSAIVINPSDVPAFAENNTAPKSDSVQLVDVSTKQYKAYLLIIDDPSRVSLGTTDGLGTSGMKLDKLLEKYGAASGINAGGFSDDNGKGSGGTPIGVLIEDGKVMCGKENTQYEMIGFNNNNILMLGYYTLQQMRENHIMNATSFSPFLIVNGEPLVKEGSVGSLQPRTVIGQTRDGKVLMLVVDGRQVSSSGATLKQVQDIMLQYNAYNAANLDGGASAQLIYNGKTINHPCSPYGPRYIPSAFIVK